MDWQTVVMAILGGGNIVQIITLLVMRNKNRAETETISIKNMEIVIGTMQEEIKRLQDRNKDLEDQVSKLQQIVNRIHV